MWASGPARTVFGVVLGALGGALYSHFIGCATGTCPITSNPMSAALFGAVLGGTIFAPDGKTAGRQSADQER
jgi:hypothetical protein